jgi:putative oxidoreductase
MPDDKLSKALLRALLALRITLGLFLLQWGVEKFVVPQANILVWSYFYGMNVSQTLGYIFGALEIAVALCIILGQFRTITYGAALFLHAVTVAVTWRQLIDPWGDPINHLFTAGIPVLGGFLALFLLRHWDRALLEK